jgi:cytochrome c553
MPSRRNGTSRTHPERCEPDPSGSQRVDVRTCRALRSPNLVALAAALLLAAAAHADERAGRQKAQAVCAACHGPLGVAAMPNTPNLAGQPESYLSEQLKAYRSGKRANEIMSLIAKPLSDSEIADLAAWFASLQIEVKTKT